MILDDSPNGMSQTKKTRDSQLDKKRATATTVRGQNIRPTNHPCTCRRRVSEPQPRERERLSFGLGAGSWIRPGRWGQPRCERLITHVTHAGRLTERQRQKRVKSR